MRAQATAKKAVPAKAVKASKASTKAAPAPEKQEVVTLKGLQDIIAESMPLMAHSTVATVVSKVFEVMTELYQEGKAVNIKDFGKLAKVHREARTARNPATGEPVQVPAKTVPKFTLARKMKEM